MIGVREGQQTTVNSRQLKTRNKRAESDFNAEDAEAGDAEIPEKIESESECGRGGNMEGSGAEPFGRLRGDILCRMSRAGGGVFEGGVELAVFGVVGEV